MSEENGKKPGSGKFALIIDDEQSNRDLERRIVGDHLGYIVVEASCAREALFLLEQHVADLIVTDYLMPEMDGLTFIKTLAKMGMANIPTVISTNAPGDIVHHTIAGKEVPERVGIHLKWDMDGPVASLMRALAKVGVETQVTPSQSTPSQGTVL